MRVPFQVAAKGMEDKNEPGHIVHGFIYFVEHMQNDTVNGTEEAVKEFAVIQKERTQGFIYSKNTVPVQDINQFEGHISRPFHCIFIAAGRTKTGVAAERDKFKFSTVGASIHGTAVGRITTVEHFVNVFHFTVTCVNEIFNFFIIVGENFF